MSIRPDVIIAVLERMGRMTCVQATQRTAAVQSRRAMPIVMKSTWSIL